MILGGLTIGSEMMKLKENGLHSSKMSFIGSVNIAKFLTLKMAALNNRHHLDVFGR